MNWYIYWAEKKPDDCNLSDGPQDRNRPQYINPAPDVDFFKLPLHFQAVSLQQPINPQNPDPPDEKFTITVNNFVITSINMDISPKHQVQGRVQGWFRARHIFWSDYVCWIRK